MAYQVKIINNVKLFLREYMIYIANNKIFSSGKFACEFYSKFSTEKFAKLHILDILNSSLRHNKNLRLSEGFQDVEAIPVILDTLISNEVQKFKISKTIGISRNFNYKGEIMYKNKILLSMSCLLLGACSFLFLANAFAQFEIPGDSTIYTTDPSQALNAQDISNPLREGAYKIINA